MSERQSAFLSLSVGAGLTLRGYLSWMGQPGPAAVLFVHGYGSRRDGEKALALETMCSQRGWSFAAFNFRGHGDSDGTLADLRAAALQEDLDAIQQALAARGIEQLFLVGSSMGGWASAWYGARHPERVRSCAGIAPAFSFPRVRWERLSEVERLGWQENRRVVTRNEARGTSEELDYGLIEDSAPFSPGELAARWSRPLLIFHGMLDEVIPYTHSLAFVEQAAGPDLSLVLYRCGDHRLLAFRHEMARAIGHFFERWWPNQP